MIATASSSTDLGHPTISVWRRQLRRETDSIRATASILWSVLLSVIQIAMVVALSLVVKKAANSMNKEDIVRIIVDAVKRYAKAVMGDEEDHAQTEIVNGSVSSPMVFH
jgi:hypothetical protein